MVMITSEPQSTMALYFLLLVAPRVRYFLSSPYSTCASTASTCSRPERLPMRPVALRSLLWRQPV